MARNSRSFNPKYSVTNGGRALNAIWENQNLTPNETLVLIFIGNKMDFRDIISASYWIALETIVKNTKLSLSTVKRVINSLVEKGYLDKRRRQNENGTLPSEFALTEKLFDEYEESLIKSEGLTVNPGGVQSEPGGGSERAAGGFTVSPVIPKEIPKDNTPNNFKGKTDSSLISKVKGVGSFLFGPSRNGPWVDVHERDTLILDAYEKYGLKVLTKLKSLVEKDGGQHQLIMRKDVLFPLCDTVRDEGTVVLS